MVLQPVHCPNCGSINVVRHGKTAQRKQRYLCQNQECRRTFIQVYTYQGYLPKVKQQISNMAVNGSGMRDTARVLKISRNTVTAVLKKTSPVTAGEWEISASSIFRADDCQPGTCRVSRTGWNVELRSIKETATMVVAWSATMLQVKS